MFFEQYSHEPYIAVVRSWHHFGTVEANRAAARGRVRARLRGARRDGVHTSRRASFFVGERYTIADIALYAYTHVAPEGGFDLAPYPAVRAWLERVRAQPNHIPITKA